MHRRIIVSIGILVTFLFQNALAQDLIIYPSDGQSAEQQSTDEGECFVWARENSGFDPLSASSPDLVAAPVTDTQQRGSAVRGAARGAIVGGIIDGSDGAKTGAAIGTLAGAGRQRRANQAAAQQQQQQVANAQQQNEQSQAAFERERETFNRYYATCLNGRGYAVN